MNSPDTRLPDGSPSIFVQEYAKLMKTADVYLGGFGILCLMLSVLGWIREDVSYRTPLIIFSFTIFNLILTQVGLRLRPEAQHRLNLFRNWTAFLICPFACFGVDGALAPWWPIYIVFTMAYAMNTGLARASLLIPRLWILGLGINWVIASWITQGRDGNFYQLAYLAGCIFMVGFTSLEWMDTAMRSLEREGQKVVELDQEKQRIATLHRELTEASRMAGMAEVAVGVLHNVGNVLNSANISAQLIDKELVSARGSGPEQILRLFQEQEGLIPDPEKRAKVVQYVEALCKNLARHHEIATHEANALRSNIDHIKGIVETQQKLARSSSMVESLSVRDLIEDTLRLSEAPFLRDGIEIVTEHESLGPILGDRHRLAQILVNLITNAQSAMNRSGHSGKRLTVKSKMSDGTIVIEVSDNGIGISPEIRDKLFTFGFTTRKDGYGFGLHSSANAAREMGGTLEARSEGVGHGATFVLRLPNHPAAG
jgi:signal transduction histidine kinase